MREIKFRAWNKKQGCWANINQLSDWGSAEMTACIGFGNKENPYQTFKVESDEIYEINQYTGLKDKNGKEIYDGDICTKKQLSGGILEPSQQRRVKIIWSEAHNGWICDDGIYQYSMRSEQLEVIGNIYENPELLK